jgi:hypothetical protein
MSHNPCIPNATRRACCVARRVFSLDRPAVGSSAIAWMKNLERAPENQKRAAGVKPQRRV